MKKILILRLSSLGDIVLTQPVTEVLREVYPDATIDYLTKESYTGVVKAFGCIDTIHTWKNKKLLLKKLRMKKYDYLIDLHSKLNTFIIKNFAGAGRNITYNKRHFYRWLLTKQIVRKNNETIVNLSLKTLKKLGIEKQNIFPRLYPDKELFKEMEKLLKNEGINNKKKLIGIFPGALHNTKMYPIEQVAQFIRTVPDKWNCQFVIMGSKKEEKLGIELKEKTQTDIKNLCGKVNIPQLIVLIDKMNVVISNDSGPMHIAAALKKPQIAIFGSTHTSLGFAPQNKNAVILQANLKCQPCSLYGTEKCPKGTFECMREITPEEIKKSLESILFN